MIIRDVLDDDIEVAIKVLIVGNGAVGKSSMIQRYCRGTFTKSYKKTIGVDFLEKQLRVHGEDVRLMLWDTAGQEEFDALTRSYYRGAQACVVAFSTTDRDSLLAVRKWRKKVEDECGDIPMVLVQNKIDLITSAHVSGYEVDSVAAEAGMKLYKTSVKEDLNVDLVFQHLAENYVKKMRSTDSIDSGFHSLSIGGPRRLGGHQPPAQARVMFKTSGEIGMGPYCEMVRYQGGRQRSEARRRPSHNVRTRSKSRDRGYRGHRYSVTSGPHGDSGGFAIADYLASPMFDSLHTRPRERSISLLARPASGPGRRLSSGSGPSIISSCKVL